MQDLIVTVIQTNLHWESPASNLAMLEEKIWKIQNKTDVICLPEMFTTGFSMNAEQLAEPMNLTTCKWMKQLAEQTGAAIVGSAIIKDKGNFYNRLIWMQPDGMYYSYDKRHLFSMAEENATFTAGTQKLIIEWKGWKICPLICYDLRFPVWSRNRNNEYDVLVYVANWPAARKVAWTSLLQARAIENLSYVIGVNRVGEDGKGILYDGGSAVIGPKGEWLWQKEAEEEIKTITLSRSDLISFREKFPAYGDADEFELK